MDGWMDGWMYTAYLGLLGHEADVGHVPHGGHVELAVLLAEADGLRKGADNINEAEAAASSTFLLLLAEAEGTRLALHRFRHSRYTEP